MISITLAGNQASAGAFPWRPIYLASRADITSSQDHRIGLEVEQAAMK